MRASAILVVAAAACSDSAGPAPVARLQVEPASAALVMGYPVQLRATTFDEKDRVLTDRPVSWTSSGPAIATVDSSGLVSTHTPGVAVISASSEGQVGHSTITVLVVPVDSVQVVPGTAELLPGDTVRLLALPLDSVGGVLNGRPASWSSSDDGVAGVSTTGLATALAPGVATISASVEGRVGTAVIAVRVPPDPCGFDGARRISLGSTTQGQLDSTDCPLGDGSFYDLYRFDLSAPTTVQIDLTSTEFDAYLFVVAGLFTVAADDNSGGNGNARIIQSLPAGTYYIAANSYDPGATGAYVLTLAPATHSSLGAAQVTGSADTPEARRNAPPKRFRPIR